MAMLMQFPVLLRADIGMLHYGITPCFNTIKRRFSQLTQARDMVYSHGLI